MDEKGNGNLKMTQKNYVKVKGIQIKDSTSCQFTIHIWSIRRNWHVLLLPSDWHELLRFWK